MDQLEEGGEDIPARMRRVVGLNEYAVAARYPNVAEPVQTDEYEEALKLADALIKWVAQLLLLSNEYGGPAAGGEGDPRRKA